MGEFAHTYKLWATCTYILEIAGFGDIAGEAEKLSRFLSDPWSFVIQNMIQITSKMLTLSTLSIRALHFIQIMDNFSRYPNNKQPNKQTDAQMLVIT